MGSGTERWDALFIKLKLVKQFINSIVKCKWKTNICYDDRIVVLRDCSDANSLQSALRLIYPVALKFDLKFTSSHHGIVGRIENKCHLHMEGSSRVFKSAQQSWHPGAWVWAAPHLCSTLLASGRPVRPL